MKSYQQRQHHLLKEMEGKFKKGETPSTLVEPVKDFANDTRVCLTSVVFTPNKLQKVIISKVAEPLRQSDERQYYYVPNSLHLTIQNVRQVHSPPSFTEDDIEKAKKVFEEIVPKFQRFSFELKRLIELPTGISITAFSDETLKDLVLDLREGLKESGLPDDKTYASDEVFFGNVSVCRYTTRPSPAFMGKVRELRNIKIGKLEVKTISLITTNSVSHPKATKIIGTFNLGN